jgi:hypothetical protein
VLFTRLVLIATFSIVRVAGATGQPAARPAPALPAVFVGAGLGPSTNDASSRMRLYEDGRATTWIIEGGVAVADRVGLGVEYSRPSAATAFTTFGAGRFQSSGRQEEQALIGVLRMRLTATPRWALDVVGGAGVLFQHHASGLCEPAQAVCDATDGPSRDEHALALATGADVPFTLTRHFALVPAVRAYWLRRGDHTSDTDINLPWQFEWKSSTRVAAFASGRVIW